MCVISDESLENLFGIVKDFNRTRCESGLTIFKSTQHPIEIWENWLDDKVRLFISDREIELSSYQYEFVKNEFNQMESRLKKYEEISSQKRVDTVLTEILGTN